VFRSRGLPFNGQLHKIDGYLAVDHGNKQLWCRLPCSCSEPSVLGVNLPGDWTCTNCTWGQPRQGIVGGHDVTAVGYDQTGVKVATWGGICHDCLGSVPVPAVGGRVLHHARPRLVRERQPRPQRNQRRQTAGRLAENPRWRGSRLATGQSPGPTDPAPPPVPGQSALLTVLHDMPKGSYAVEPLTVPRMPGGNMSVTWIDWLRQIIALLDDLLNKHAAEQNSKERISV
jgi:hypothetical protein